MLVIFKNIVDRKEITRFYDKQSAPVVGDFVILLWNSETGFPMRFEGKVLARTMEYDHSLDPETAIVDVKIR